MYLKHQMFHCNHLLQYQQHSCLLLLVLLLLLLPDKHLDLLFGFDLKLL